MDAYGLRSPRGSSSDIYYCSACREKGHKIESVQYCSQCVKHYCRDCAYLHDELFPAHSVSGTEHARTHPRQEVPSSSHSEPPTCHRHIGHELNMYCGDHDVIVCTMCAAGDHRYLALKAFTFGYKNYTKIHIFKNLRNYY